MIVIITKHNMGNFGVNPFFKLQKQPQKVENKNSLVAKWKNKNNLAGKRKTKTALLESGKQNNLVAKRKTKTALLEKGRQKQPRWKVENKNLLESGKKSLESGKQKQPF